MANSWIEFVKSYSKEKGMKYNEALKDSGLKSAYEKSKKGMKKGEPKPKPVKAPMKKGMKKAMKDE